MIIVATLLTGLISHAANATLTLNKTRYIYDSDQQSISLTIKNPSQKLYGGQVWVDNVSEKGTRPYFINSPSFFKIKGKAKQIVRVMKVAKDLPKNKESIFMLNLQDIPPSFKGNGVAVAVRNQVKLIYRPHALEKGRKGAESDLTVRYLPGEQELVNTTPYIFAIGEVKDIHGKAIKFTKKQQKKLLMFMPDDKVNVTGYKVKSVIALNDEGNPKEYILKSADTSSNKH
ncbi:Clp protease ClpE [Photobacterium leiognathi subsp. mandapamensis]|nr:Clp protease ClpE [Photobacterium leiognathi subsp. mandapamensis]